ncbi:Histone-lysine N-methyltransferase SETMAR, partial [Eumeta japonica]
ERLDRSQWHIHWQVYETLQPGRNRIKGAIGNEIESGTGTGIYTEYGNLDVEDDPRSGRPITDKVDAILEKVEQDLHISSYDIAEELEIDHSIFSFFQIYQKWNSFDPFEKVRYTKKVNTWVPHELTERNLMNRVLVCDSLLKHQFGSLLLTVHEIQARSREKTAVIDQHKRYLAIIVKEIEPCEKCTDKQRSLCNRVLLEPFGVVPDRSVLKRGSRGAYLIRFGARGEGVPQDGGGCDSSLWAFQPDFS